MAVSVVEELEVVEVRHDERERAAVALGPLDLLGQPLLVQATYVCASAMITEAILSFIGAGTPPNIPSWGNIMAEARSMFQIAGYLILFPGICLSITVLAVNLLGDGLRDALDPRLARRM
jgi:peptide/nickel transport system permease protein